MTTFVRSAVLPLLATAAISAILSCTAEAFTEGPIVSDYAITFSNQAFNGLNSSNAFTFTDIPAQSPGTEPYDAGFYPATTNIAFVTTGGITVTYPTPTPGQISYPLTIQTNGSPGTLSFDSEVPGSTPFRSDVWVTETNGLPTLNFLATDGDSYEQLHSFTVNVTLPGNWSTSGTTAGTHKLLAADLSPDFTISSNFVYNPVTNTTLVTATDPDYFGDESAGLVGLSFQLFGSDAVSAVPETPLMGSLAGIACFGAWMFVRRRARLA